MQCPLNLTIDGGKGLLRHLRKLSKKFFEAPEYPNHRTLELVCELDHLRYIDKSS